MFNAYTAYFANLILASYFSTFLVHKAQGSTYNLYLLLYIYYVDRNLSKEKNILHMIIFNATIFNIYLLFNGAHYAAYCARSSFSKNLTLCYFILSREESPIIYLA